MQEVINALFKLTVVIPSYGRDGVLCETVSALLKICSCDHEIIIVDQTKSHDSETDRFLNNLPENVRLLKFFPPSLPAARNHGVRHATSDIVLFLDDDITPDPNLIASHLRHYKDSSVGGVAGRILPPDRTVKSIDPRYYHSKVPWLYIRFDQDWPVRKVESAPGGNMSFRRLLIERVGGFDENFTGNAFREETDFCLRLRKMGHRIIFDPDACVIHHFGTPGGCNNVEFSSVSSVSLRYWMDFFHNNIYFLLSHLPKQFFPGVLYEIFRRYAANRGVLSGGWRSAFIRVLSFIAGLLIGWCSWMGKSDKRS